MIGMDTHFLLCLNGLAMSKQMVSILIKCGRIELYEEEKTTSLLLGAPSEQVIGNLPNFKGNEGIVKKQLMVPTLLIIWSAVDHAVHSSLVCAK